MGEITSDNLKLKHLRNNSNTILLLRANLSLDVDFRQLAYTNLPKVFVQHKITLVVNVPLWTNIELGAMMGIKIYKYRKHTVLALSLVKI